MPEKTGSEEDTGARTSAPTQHPTTGMSYPLNALDPAIKRETVAPWLTDFLWQLTAFMIPDSVVTPDHGWLKPSSREYISNRLTYMLSSFLHLHGILHNFYWNPILSIIKRHILWLALRALLGKRRDKCNIHPQLKDIWPQGSNVNSNLEEAKESIVIRHVSPKVRLVDSNPSSTTF